MYIVIDFFTVIFMKKTSKKPTKAELKGKFGEFLILEKLPGYFLLLVLLISLVLIFYLISPFITVILIGAFLAIAFYPIYKRLNKLFRGMSRLASMVSILLIVILVLAPLSFFVLLLGAEALDTYEVVQEKVNSGVFDQYLQWGDGGFFYDIKENLKPYVESVVDLDDIDIKQTIIDTAKSLSTWLVSQATGLAKNILWVLLSLVVMLFSMYYFFKDGDKLVKKVGQLSPLPFVYEIELFAKIKSMVNAVVFGIFLTAIVQGLLGGIGFTIAGISNPVFWGTVMAFFSIVPVVGTALIWIPAVIILLILGSWGSALFLLLWGILVVGTVDNVIKPYVIVNRAHTYPLLTFLVVIGGIMVMQLKGVIIGPIILVVLMSFLHIYQSEYKKVLKK